MGDLVRRAAERGEIAAELSRRDVLTRASLLGAGALIASALPIVEHLVPAAEAAAVLPGQDPLLQAFADTIIPGRPATRTDLGDVIHPGTIAGVDKEAGAVEADALRIMNDSLLGFPVLAPVFIADLTPRALAAGGDFVSLDFEDRVKVVSSGLDFGNPLRLVWEGAAGLPFLAFCAGAAQVRATSRTHSGYRVMGYPGAAPGGYRDFSYRRKLARERTKKGYLP
jgi:hypothetical protein